MAKEYVQLLDSYRRMFGMVVAFHFNSQNTIPGQQPIRKMVNTPVISICIPCFKRLEQVRNTLKSIYEDNSDVELSLFEVVISDNDPESEVEKIVPEFSKYENFSYHKTQCKGFMNSYYALTYGLGDFLKLHNSQIMFKPCVLKTLIEEVRANEEKKTLFFYTSGLLCNFTSRHYNSFEDFMIALSYWSSWSGGMTIWREKFEKVKGINLNHLFPHTSLFLTQFDSDEFCINDTVIYDVQRVKKRGDHNKFEAFTRHYPALINQSCIEGHIKIETRNKIFKGIYTEFLPTLLFNKYIARIETFDASGFKDNCRVFFPPYAYWLAWLNVPCVPFRLLYRRICQKLRG